MTFARLKTYWHIWNITAQNALQTAFINRWTNLMFFVGKAFRLGMSLSILLLIKQNITSFAGYTPDQMIVFFLTYQWVDIIAQIFFRGVYVFSNEVRSGTFDFMLIKPVNALFRALTGLPDINDTIFFIPTTLISLYLLFTLNLSITWVSVLWYLFLLAHAFLIATSLHIMVLVVGILTTEVDGVMWLYRDLTRFGQFPVTIYPDILKTLLFFLVPVGLMVTIPSQVLIGVTPTFSIAVTAAISWVVFGVSLGCWHWAVKQYSSTGS